MDPIQLIYESLIEEANIINLDQFIDGVFAGMPYNDYIRRWLKTHFKKYLIKLDPHDLGSTILPYTPDESDPEWMKGKELYTIIDLPPIIIDNMNHVLDWMESLDERGLKKLDRITFEQALEHANRWTEEINKKAKDDEDWFNVKTVMEWPDGFKMVLIRGDVCLSREGKLMGHCVGGGNYKNADIYSLRDKNNEPHVTLEVEDHEVYQIKGKENKAPIEKYHSYIKEFISKTNLDVAEDGRNIGMLQWHNMWYDPDSERWQEIYDSEIIPAQEEAIEEILDRIEDGRIIGGNVVLNELYLKNLPDLSNITVTGHFYCTDNLLQSLKGAPKEVGKTFDCSYNPLKTLEGAPKKVDLFKCTDTQIKTLKGGPTEANNFICMFNQLVTLEGGPKKIGESFDCSHNEITTLEGGPNYVDMHFHCTSNQLTSLHGAPEYIGGSLLCSNNQLTTLEGAPEEIGGALHCGNNQLTTLEGGPKKVTSFYGTSNPLKSLKGAPLVSDIFVSDQFSHSDYLAYMQSLKTESFQQFYYTHKK